MRKINLFDSKTCTLIGLITNIALAIFKLFAGIFGFSYAMIADAIHSMSDCLATGTVYVGLRIGERPPDKSHPYGHANAETIAAFLVALIILATGTFIGVSAIQLMAHRDLETPATIALIAAATSIVIKEIMFRYTLKVGKRTNSPAVIANAWDHRSDAYSSIGSLAGIAGARLGFQYLDPIAGLVISAVIVKMSLTILHSTIGIFMDERPEQAVLNKISAAVLEVEGIKAIDSIRAHRRGSTFTIDIEVAVDSNITVEQGHQVASEVKNRLVNKIEHVQDVMVHVNPHHLT
ncbi:MAG TPA: cation diffusion facilitator family transporter [Dehalococcoidia bacterium]|nr:cation diffusion facilitator family transporter [Dehalococcoidia bacterium]